MGYVEMTRSTLTDLGEKGSLIYAVIVRDGVLPGWITYVVSRHGQRYYFRDRLGHFVSFNTIGDSLIALREVVDSSDTDFKVYKLDVFPFNFFANITHLYHMAPAQFPISRCI